MAIMAPMRIARGSERQPERRLSSGLGTAEPGRSHGAREKLARRGFLEGAAPAAPLLRSVAQAASAATQARGPPIGGGTPAQRLTYGASCQGIPSVDAIQARAKRHWRPTVATELSQASAISSIDSPPNNRISTTLAVSGWTRASSVSA